MKLIKFSEKDQVMLEFVVAHRVNGYFLKNHQWLAINLRPYESIKEHLRGKPKLSPPDSVLI